MKNYFNLKSALLINTAVDVTIVFPVSFDTPLAVIFIILFPQDCNGVQREHNKNLIMDCQSYTKYRPNETTGGIFVSWRRKEELPTGA